MATYREGLRAASEPATQGGVHTCHIRRDVQADFGEALV